MTIIKVLKLDFAKPKSLRSAGLKCSTGTDSGLLVFKTHNKKKCYFREYFPEWTRFPLQRFRADYLKQRLFSWIRLLLTAYL